MALLISDSNCSPHSELKMTQQIQDLIVQAKGKNAEIESILTQIATLVEEMEEPEPPPQLPALFRERGFTLSNGGAKVLNITAGAWLSDDIEPSIIESGAGSVDLTVSGLGGLDSGAPVADTTYHIFAIARLEDETAAFIASASPSGPILPAGYDLKRRIGSIPTNGSGNFIGFTQRGSEFLRLSPLPLPTLTNPGVNGVPVPVGVPVGVQVNALLTIALYTGSATYRSLLVTSPDQADDAASGTKFSLRSSGLATDRQTSQFDVRTDAAGRIRTRLETSDANASIFMISHGWIDERRCL